MFLGKTKLLFSKMGKKKSKNDKTGKNQLFYHLFICFHRLFLLYYFTSNFLNQQFMKRKKWGDEVRD